MNERISYKEQARVEVGGIIAARAREEFVIADDKCDLPAKRKALRKRLLGLCLQNPRRRDENTWPMFHHEIADSFWAVSEGNE